MTTREIKEELAAMRETMTAGFARADRYFELQQLQFIEFRDHAFDFQHQVFDFQHQVFDFRDHVVGALNEISNRLLALTARVDHLETGGAVTAQRPRHLP